MNPTRLPAWMWRDPAEVIERMEQEALAKVEREARRRSKRRGEQGLSEQTVLCMRRLRIRELVANVLKGGNR